jgi:two-component system, LuxR family, response regulator FixJ
MAHRSVLSSRDFNAAGINRQGPEMTSTGGAIAVVDDDAAVCDSTRLLLETYEYDVHTYQTGAEFLRDDPAIACLIVDYHMPGLNGLELVSELRRRGRYVPVIIMITATTNVAVQRHATELGIKQVLTKPLPNQALLNAVRNEVK